MPTAWDAFIKEYGKEIFNWSLIYTLEVFWHYCQGGEEDVYKFLERGYKNAKH